MKKLLKRTLAMVLTVALCASMLQITAFATEDPEPPETVTEQNGEPAADSDEPAADSDEPPADGDEPPADSDEPPADGDVPPADGDEPAADSDVPPADGDEPPADGDVPPADGEAVKEGEVIPAPETVPPVKAFAVPVPLNDELPDIADLGLKLKVVCENKGCEYHSGQTESMPGAILFDMVPEETATGGKRLVLTPEQETIEEYVQGLGHSFVSAAPGSLKATRKGDKWSVPGTSNTLTVTVNCDKCENCGMADGEHAEDCPDHPCDKCQGTMGNHQPTCEYNGETGRFRLTLGDGEEKTVPFYGNIGENIETYIPGEIVENGVHYALDKVTGTHPWFVASSGDGLSNLYEQARNDALSNYFPKDLVAGRLAVFYAEDTRPDGGDGIPDKYQVFITYRTGGETPVEDTRTMEGNSSVWVPGTSVYTLPYVEEGSGFLQEHEPAALEGKKFKHWAVSLDGELLYTVSKDTDETGEVYAVIADKDGAPVSSIALKGLGDRPILGLVSLSFTGGSAYTVEAVFEDIAPVMTDYLVEWRTVLEDGADTRLDRKTRTAEVGKEVSVAEEDKVYEGYTFQDDAPGNVLTTKVTKDGKAALVLYFTKNPEPEEPKPEEPKPPAPTPGRDDDDDDDDDDEDTTPTPPAPPAPPAPTTPTTPTRPTTPARDDNRTPYNPPIVIIDEPEVPMARSLRAPVPTASVPTGELIEIPDGDVPLAGLPGEPGTGVMTHTGLWAALLAVSLAGALLLSRKDGEEAA